MIKLLKKNLSFIFRKVFNEEIQKELVIKAKLLSIKNRNLKKIKDLSEVEFQVYSQWGEDGIIDWLVNKSPDIPKSFLEIGTENYKESNTRFLLVNKNWDGFIIEADKSSVKDIKSQRIYWKHNLTVENKFISQNNINTIIKKNNIPRKLGLLSLDIDGVDYWILKKLSVLEPSIIICEYNSLFGQKKAITVPYKNNYIRSNEHFSNLFYGASIRAFIDLLKKRNYFFIGTNSAGNNAFFVKQNIWKKVNKLITDKKIFDSKFRESRNSNGKLTFLNKKKSLQLIKNKIVIDLKNNKKRKLFELGLFN
tara:strand:+ start:5432 stop:6355 length:924 start_codon:yes stop_codon:yes gene_type:complete